MLLQLLRREVPEIEQDEVVPPLLQLGINRVRDDIAGSERLPFVIYLHELVAVARLQNSAEPPDRFGNEV